MHQEMYVQALTLYLLTWITNLGVGTGSSVFFPVEGNVYPLGYYTVAINIGNPSKFYVLDVDTGSDLTWIRSYGENAYIPKEENKLSCDDLICTSLGDHRMNGDICDSTGLSCEFEVDYGDYSSYTGLLVSDSFHLELTNGTTLDLQIAFGSVDSNVEPSFHQPIGDGLLGLGKGKVGILKQLGDIGLIRNVIGHCLSRQGGGYLFFGETPVYRITWKQLSCINDEHYSLGSADILLDGQATDIRNLCIIFDSGSTFTYLNSKSYEALLDLVNKTINGKLSVANDDKALPFCWKDVMPIQTIDQVARAFSPIALNFTDENNVVQFEMLPESYLIITEKHNICLGILNGGEIGLGDVNLIGDISMQDKLVIYDNENHMVGWAADTCNKRF
ncbi:hypothetical protein CASFOL_016745 [Castilleja foliolosa]|uniref:Peptidase A1 domain-containing protein n=1 Tax=Castilleja foliolosa TaxID=1961234 RepID=A0ABD3D9M2_9LAMI